jgi:xanthine dehydrogenase YagS FAD-binding subunit
MHPFRYERAADVPAAVTLLAESPHGAFLGGGTNLVDLMRLGVATPDLLVDVRRLTSDRIEERADGGMRIGAAVPNSDLAADRRVRTRYPVLSEAVLAGASGQLRNLATTGGNLLQRTRCVYFQDVTTGCNKREPGSGCSAIDGYHRELAIFGTSAACIATHPSDLAVALAALDADVHIQGPDGQRIIPLTELHRLPGDQPQRDTVLRHGDLITGVELPPLSFATTSRYRKVRDRASYAFALVSVAAALDVDDGVVRDVRIALGGVAPKPWRATTAERLLRGAPATLESFRGAAEAELAEARPLTGNAFKIPLARNVITSTLLALLDGSR